MSFQRISEDSIYPMGFTRCECLPRDLKARFKMYFFQILPPAESNHQKNRLLKSGQRQLNCTVKFPIGFDKKSLRLGKNKCFI